MLKIDLLNKKDDIHENLQWAGFILMQ